MSWKKNVISYYPIWLIYTLLTLACLASLSGVYSQLAGVSVYWGFLFAALYAACVGGIVFLIHWMWRKISPWVKKRSGLFAVFEAAIVVILFAVGIVFRVRGIEYAGQAAAYFETAQVVLGQEIPQVTHGAVYFYLQALRGVFALLGNHFVAGIGLQVALQMTASLVLFFVMRKMAGSVAGLITFSFCMCSPYMINQALMLSPEMLYFLIFSVALALTIVNFRKKLEPFYFLVTGVMAALCAYLDVAGILLLFFALAVVFCCREENAGFQRKAAAVFLCIIGFILGFAAFCFVDAYLSAKPILGVLEAWTILYQPDAFRLPITVGNTEVSWDIVALIGLMVFGIFSYWCHKEEERHAVLLLAVCGVAVASCFGIFTEEMPGFLGLYLLFVVLASVSVGQCFAGEPVPQIFEDEIPEGEPAKMKEPVSELPEEPIESTQAAQGKAVEGPRVQERKVQFIENPLPLPKKRKKRVLEYAVELTSENDDFDVSVSEDDDFDI